MRAVPVTAGLVDSVTTPSASTTLSDPIAERPDSVAVSTGDQISGAARGPPMWPLCAASWLSADPIAPNVRSTFSAIRCARFSARRCSAASASPRCQ